MTNIVPRDCQEPVRTLLSCAFHCQQVDPDAAGVQSPAEVQVEAYAIDPSGDLSAASHPLTFPLAGKPPRRRANEILRVVGGKAAWLTGATIVSEAMEIRLPRPRWRAPPARTSVLTRGPAGQGRMVGDAFGRRAPFDHVDRAVRLACHGLCHEHRRNGGYEGLLWRRPVRHLRW